MHKKITRILKMVLIFWSVYALVGAGSYLFNIKLASVYFRWPVSAFAYSEMTGRILGSLFLLISFLAFIAQKDLDKYREIIKISGVWAIFHGVLLIFSGLSQNYLTIFANFPSLHVWLPFYNQYLIVEGLTLIAYSGIVYLWIKK